MAKPTTIQDVACLGCACVCDDIEVVVEDGRIVEARSACPLGQAWFLEPAIDDPTCSVDGKPCAFDAAVAEAVRWLGQARRPLVTGLTRVDGATQRHAVAIAERLGGSIAGAPDPVRSAAGRALQAVGAVTSTLGEVANRSRLIVYWGADPAVAHPRHAERYSLEPRGTFVPAGRSDRCCVLISANEQNQTRAWADEVILVPPGAHWDALALVHSLVKEHKIDGPPDNGLGDRVGGQSLATWRSLAARMRAAQYGVIFFGEELTSVSHGPLVVEALLRLVADLNDYTRFVCHPLALGANSAGLEEVLAWTTGFAAEVDFSRGYPRFYPGEHSRPSLATDVVLQVGPDDEAEPSGARRIVLDWTPRLARAGEIHIAVAKPGIAAGGTVYRMDGVPLPLRPALTSALPEPRAALKRILDGLRGRP